MARKAREKSPTGIYHVLVTAEKGTSLFQDDQDKEKYVALLMEYADICSCQIYAYCLMDTHVHLLINEGDSDISRIMKRLGTSYVYWVHTKYHRTGQLFEDRFKSQVVLTDEDFKTHLRFIHRVPVQLLACSHVEDYRFSSYQGYFTSKVISSGMASRVFHNDLQLFSQYHREQTSDRCLQISRSAKKLTDEALRVLFQREFSIVPNQLIGLTQERQFKIILYVMKNYNVPIRQLGRLTGISLTTIWRMVDGALSQPMASSNK